MVEYEPFIKSRLALRDYLLGLTWCNFGHVTSRNPAPKKTFVLTVWIVAPIETSRVTYSGDKSYAGMAGVT
jgi:hypothetical protein